MRKAERLFQLITLLRGRRLAVTAKQLAEILEVSERTIYRDIQALTLSGVPIEGEAGIGYLLHREFELPPLMFTSEELLALLVGSKMVQSWSDKALALGATSAMEKITAILPDKLKQTEAQSPIVIPDYFKNEAYSNLALTIRQSIANKNQVLIDYCDAQNASTTRVIEPLGLVFWGGKWTVIAYCILRQAYREFRIDRVKEYKITEDKFDVTKTKSLQHYLAIVSCDKDSKTN